MQFLVLQKMQHPIPPEHALPLFEAMRAWIDECRQAGRLTAVWNFAGQLGGGGIADVPDHEALDAMIATNPLAPFSSLETIPLSDIDQAFDTQIQAIKDALAAMA